MIRRATRSFLLSSILTMLSLPALAQPALWEIDAAHSSVGFAVRHMMISRVNGQFAGFSGTVELDPAAPAAAKIEAKVQVKTVDTGNGQRDAHLLGPDFFDAARFPEMVFVARQVEPLAPGKLRILGDLTLRGVTRPVVLDAEGFDSEVKDPFGAVRTGGTARTTINRKDFGMAWNKSLQTGGLLIGEEVTITLDIELIKKS